MVTRARTAGWLLAAAFLGTIGCDSTVEPPDSAVRDAMATPSDAAATPDGARDASAIALELGTGASAWVDFEDGEELLLQRGCQGSQHVFVSARVRGPASGRLVLRLAIRRERDGLEVSLPFEVRLPFDESPRGEARQEVGLTPVVPIPSDIVGEAVTIEGEVEDEEGLRATAVRSALVRWGPDACG